MTDLSVSELRAKREANEDFILLDVREPDEVATASIPGATLIPMMQIPQRFGELDPTRPIVVMCHHGARSERVAGFLEANGFASVANLEGGIDAWSVLVDSNVPRY